MLWFRGGSGSSSLFLKLQLLRVLCFRAVNFTRVSLVMFSVSPSLPFPGCLTLDVFLDLY